MIGNKGVFDAEVFAIYQALRTFEARQQSGRRYMIFSDSQPAIRRAMMDYVGPGQQWAMATIEVASRLVANGNEVRAMWVPAHKGVGGNEVANRAAKEDATEVVLEFLKDTPVGSRSSGMARANVGERESVWQV